MPILSLHSIAAHKNHKINSGRALKCAGFRAGTALAGIAAALLFAPAAQAQIVPPFNTPTQCNSTDGITVTCTGDLSEGISITHPTPYTTLYVNPDGDIAPNPGINGIRFHSRTGEVRIFGDPDGFDIEVSGDNTKGISARTWGGDDVWLEHVGDITTNGTGDDNNSSGIYGITEFGFKPRGGSLTITHTGDITTNRGHGIYAATWDTNDVSVTQYGNIVSGDRGIRANVGNGISGDAFYGSATVKMVGDITVSDRGGPWQDGILAESYNDDVMITHTGNIINENPGVYADGIAAFGKGTSFTAITISHTGSIRTAGGDGVLGEMWDSANKTVAYDGEIHIILGNASTALDGSTITGSTIDAAQHGVAFYGGTTNTLTVHNDVEISGGEGFSDIRGGDGEETIIIHGRLTSPGDIVLGGGDDVIRNYGELTTGTIDLGGGDNSFINDEGSVSDAVQLTVSGGGTLSIDNRGTINSNDEFAIDASGGLITLDNSGAINGMVQLTTVDEMISVTSDGTIATEGDGAHGVYAFSETGDISITATGTISTQGDAANGVEANSDTGDIIIAVNNVYTEGEDAIAVYAGTGATGTLDITVTGVVTAAQADAVHAMTEGGAISIANSGTLTSSGFAVNASGGVVTLGNTGTINGQVQLSAFDDVLTNSGSITGDIAFGAGNDLFVNSGSFIGDVDFCDDDDQLDNSGNFTGSIQFGTGDDVLNNSGLFNAGADSDFGDGTDLFTNIGTTRVTGVVTFTGLEHFQNDGTVDMANGGTGDQLILPGTYDAGSDLHLDVNFDGMGMSDVLTIGGAATGSTEITINPVGETPNFGIHKILIVDAGEGTPADAFSVAEYARENGWFVYDVLADEAANDFYLVNSVGSSVFRMLKHGEATASLWYRSADAWGAHNRQRRDADDASVQSPLWLEVYAAKTSRDDRRSFSGNTIEQSFDTGYSQDHYGFQLGYEFGIEPREGMAVIFGMTGGYQTSHLGWDGTADQARYDDRNIGVSAGVSYGGFYANTLAKLDYVSADITAGTTGFGADVDARIWGVRAEYGYRWERGGFFAEPSVSVEYQQASLDNIEALGAVIDFDRWDGFRGMAGMRLGAETGLGSDSVLIVYGSGRAVREFKGDGTFTFASGLSRYRVSNHDAQIFGRFDLGVSVRTAGGVSGFIEANSDQGDSQEGYAGRAGLRLAF